MRYYYIPLGGRDYLELASSAEREFQQIEQAFAEQDFVQLAERHTAPEKVRDGLTVLADGTDWNPGSGQGVYTYYNGAWHKLG